MSSSKNSQEVSTIAPSSRLIIGDDTSQYIENQIKNGWPDLMPAEIAFAQEYCVNGYNHRLAAEHVGRPLDSGITLVRKPLIRSYIAWIQQEQRTESLITKDFIEAQMMHQYEKANGDVAVAMVDSEGNEFTAKNYQGQLSVGILKEFNNMFGHSKVEKSSESKVTVIVDMGALTGRPPVTVDIEEGEIIENE